VDQGPNLVVNGGFEDGLNGWTLQGSHDFSSLAAADLQAAEASTCAPDPGATPIQPHPVCAIRPGRSRRGQPRCRCGSRRNAAGHPELLLRLHGSATEAYGRMVLPRALGSPGLPNSRRVAMPGPRSMR